ncbi:MAG: thiamine-phosphate kinase [Sphingomonas sp.]|nr:thiamine-phosphate kinase [Sphingomonas sp.]
MNEAQAIERLRKFATDPAARGLADDVALFDGLVITHDSIAEGVHFLPDDPAASVGWKLVTVNLSDLAAKGAEPAAALLSLAINQDGDWVDAFIGGVEAACTSYGLPLIGGDTIALPALAPRVFGLTAIGRAGPKTPSRGGGKSGDRLWVVGTFGDSAAGLALLKDDPKASGLLVESYRRPVPQLAVGRALAPLASAMMDVSDGLLIDARRLAEASGCTASIDLDAVPLSAAFIKNRGDSLTARLFAATGGDDYALLAALPAEADPLRLSLPSGTTIACIGTLGAGSGPLRIASKGQPVALPEVLGYEHRGNIAPPVGDCA